MKRLWKTVVAFCLVGNLFAWGPEGHRWIHARALEKLPPPLASQLQRQRHYLIEHANDPDLWRETDPEEGPRHFIDLDNYGQFPFPQLSLDYSQMVQRHGAAKVRANGLVLWTIPQVLRRLEAAFRSGDQDKILREASALGHYVADLHQPFHAVANYNGQFTGQWGIHARFEEEVVRRIAPKLRMRTGAIRPIDDPLKESFDVALDSFSMVYLILAPEWRIVRDLKLNRDALPRDPEKKFAIYPEDYFRLLTEKTGAVAERRMQDAAWAVASFWTQAWKNSRK